MENELSLSKLKELYTEYLYGNDNNSFAPVDIEINDSGDGYFAATLLSQDDIGKKAAMTTGYGGLKMMAKQMGGFALIKMSYNDIILNLEQREEIYKKLINE